MTDYTVNWEGKRDVLGCPIATSKPDGDMRPKLLHSSLKSVTCGTLEGLGSSSSRCHPNSLWNSLLS